jgi:hypothetical protein
MHRWHGLCGLLLLLLPIVAQALTFSNGTTTPGVATGVIENPRPNTTQGALNNVTITAPATGATFTLADGKTFTVSNTLTLTGTDASSVAFGTGGTVAYTANKLSAFAATTSAELAGVVSNETGTGFVMFSDSPTVSTQLDITGTGALVRLAATPGSPGGFAWNRDVASLGLGGGMYWDGAAYRSSYSQAVGIIMSSGVISFTSNSGLTAPNTFSPTTMMDIATTGVATMYQQAVMAAGVLSTPPGTQTIAAGNTITANACGGVKNITAGGAVTTDTTNTFTAPGATNAGCVMSVCNTGATNTITLDQNALFKTTGGANVALAANTCVVVTSDGSVWRQISAALTAT